MANNCRKFVPNMFDKYKCQSCFKAKDLHSAEALECSKIARKISKCGYLFVCPDTFDFSNPMDKTRRWQRRFMVLYDDGELTYSVDDNVNTIPQGVINMNQCTEVFDAVDTTCHEFSIAVKTGDNKKPTYVKGMTKEEISKWFDVLVMYPRANNSRKTRKAPNFIIPQKTQKQAVTKEVKQEQKENVKPSLVSTPAPPVIPTSAPPAPHHAPRYPTNTTSTISTRTQDPGRTQVARTRSVDVLSYNDVPTERAVPKVPTESVPKAPVTYRGVRSMKQHHQNKAAGVSSSSMHAKLKKSNSLHDLTDAVGTSGSGSGTTSGAGTTGMDTTDPMDKRYRSQSRDPPIRRRRTTDPGKVAIPDPTPTSSVAAPRSPTTTLLLLNGRNKNETDERKMAKSSDLRSAVAGAGADDRKSASPRASPSRQAAGDSQAAAQEDVCLKKGWLLQQGISDKEWNKHWFVLSGQSLKYYQDSWSEDTGHLDGVIDLSTCCSVENISVNRNYGFRLKTAEREYVLSAMTSGIRVNWLMAVEKCMELQKSKPTITSSSQQQEHNVPNKPTYAWSQSQSQSQSPKRDTNLGKNEPKSPKRPSLSKDGNLKGRRMTVDIASGFSSEEQLSRRRSSSGAAETNHKHRTSCTWPYVSPDREVGVDSEVQQKSAAKKSELAELVAEQDRRERQEREKSRERESSGSRSRSSSFDHLRSSEERELGLRQERERHDSGTSNASSTNSRRQANYPRSPRSKSPRAPSARVKDRSRAKSPRPKSPILDETDQMVDRIVQQGEESSRSFPADDIDGSDPMNDIIEKKWREVSPQIQDIQDELDSRTSQYKKKLGDHDKHAQLSSLQVQTLKEQLHEARETVKRRDETITRLESQLHDDSSSLSSTQADLNRAILDAKDEAETWKEKTRSIEAQLKQVQKELKESNVRKAELEKSVKANEKELRELRRDAGAKGERIGVLERALKDGEAFRGEFEEKEDFITDLQQEIKGMKKQLREQDAELQKQQKDAAKRTKQMEDEFYAEKQKLEGHIEKLKKRLDDSSKHSDLSSEKDETIAQLEEKLIEKDNKIVEVQEEIKIEIEDNTKLQQSLDQAYTDKTALTHELEEAKNAIEMLEHELEQVGQQNQSLSMNKTDLQKEMEQLRKRSQELNVKVNELEEENGALRMVIDGQGSDLINWEDKYQNDVEELQQRLESHESTGKSDDYEEELHNAYLQLEELHKEHEELKTEMTKEHASTEEQLHQAEKIFDELNEELKKKESECDEQKVELGNLRAGGKETRKESDMVSEKDYEELKKKLSTSTKDLTQTKHKLKQTEVQCEQYQEEIAKFKGQLNTSQRDSELETHKLNETVKDLTNKLGIAERRVKRFEAWRRAEYEKEESPPPLSTSSTSSDSDLINKIQTLEQELKSSQTQLQASQAQTLEQRSLQVEVTMLRQTEQQLKQKNDEFSRQRKSQKANVVVAPEDHDEVKDRLAEVQLRLEKHQSVLEECRSKINDVVKSLPKSSDLQASKLQTVQKDLADLLSKDSCQVSEDDRTRLFRERLALEAVVLGEMAYLVRCNDTDLITAKEHVLQDIEDANHRIMLLEQTVASSHGKDMKTPPKTVSDTANSSVQMYSRLLADKMLLQQRMCGLIDEKQNGESKSSSSPRTVPQLHSQTAEHLAQKALFKTKLGERLHTHSSHNISSPTTSLASHSLAQGQLRLVLEKLEAKAAENISQKEKVECVQAEISSAKNHLLERQTAVEDSVESLRQEHLGELASVIARQVRQQPKSSSTQKQFDKECVQSEVTVLVNKYTEMYESRLPVDTSGRAAQRSSVIEEYVQKEIKQNVEELVKKCEQKMKDVKEVDGEVDKDLETKKSQLLLKLADLLAQKAILGGQIAYVNQQIQAQQQTGSQSQPRKKSIKRHDSGIQVHGASLPTSPIGELELDQGELAEQLQKEAATKSEIAAFLVNNASNGGQSQSQSSESLDVEITRLASEMARLDVMLMSNSNVSSKSPRVSHFADVLSNEAMFQAQMSYITNTLKLKHKQEVEQFRIEFENAEEQRRQQSQNNVAELEEEIHRLGTVLAENESKYQRSLHGAQVSLTDEEIARKEKQCKQEIQSLKDGYEIRIRSLQADLEGLRTELENMQKEQYSERTGYEEKLELIEQELRAERREKLELCQSKDEEIQDYNDKIGQLEEELSSALDSVPSPRDRASGDDHSLLESAQEEVIKLKSALAEEKTRHMSELLTVREELQGGGDGGMAASQNELRSRVQDLEEQLQNMQSDYEQELMLAKSAHRRELARSKDEMLELRTQAEAKKDAKSMKMDDESNKHRNRKEINRIQELYNRTYASMEKNHQNQLMEMRKSHAKNMEKLRAEKDQLLDEETKATQSALDAMRKAHDAELQKERSKFLDMLAKTYSHGDVETLQKQHEEDQVLIHKEITLLSEEYSMKCLELGSIEERLDMQTKALADSRKKCHDLRAKNDELSAKIKHELERLNQIVNKPLSAAASSSTNGESQEEIQQLKVAMKVKVAEVKAQEEEIATLRRDLKTAQEELKESLDKNEEIFSDRQDMRRRLEKEVQDLKRTMTDREQASNSARSEADEEEEGQEAPTFDSHDTPEGSEDGNIVSRRFQLLRTASSSDVLQGSLGSGSLSRSSSGSLSGTESASSSRPTSAGRQLPTVSEEARTNKKALWRQRHPERARSNPGPVVMSLPSVTSSTNTTSSSSRFSRRISSHSTSVQED